MVDGTTRVTLLETRGVNPRVRTVRLGLGAGSATSRATRNESASPYAHRPDVERTNPVLPSWEKVALGGWGTARCPTRESSPFRAGRMSRVRGSVDRVAAGEPEPRAVSYLLYGLSVRTLVRRTRMLAHPGSSHARTVVRNGRDYVPPGTVTGPNRWRPKCVISTTPNPTAGPASRAISPQRPTRRY